MKFKGNLKTEFLIYACHADIIAITEETLMILMAGQGLSVLMASVMTLEIC